MGLIKFNRNHEKYAEPAPLFTNKSVIKPNIIVGGVLKDTTFKSLAPECTLLCLTEENYANILEDKKVNLMLVDYIKSDEESEFKNSMISILSICKGKEICSIFWDTEDNEDFYNNIKLIKQFDYVFTINPDRIKKYKKVLKNKNVFFLPFAVQPRIYSPIERNIMCKEDDISRKSFEIDRVMGSAYKIYSLLYKKENQEELSSIPKEIYEMLGLGTTMICPYSKAIEDLFPQIIKLYKSDDEMADIINPLLKDKDAIDKLSVLGQRNVLNSHTYTNRIDTILQKIGLLNQPSDLPGVSIVTATNRVDSMENIFENYENQNYGNKELIVVLNNNKMDLGEWKNKAQEYKNVKVFQIDENQPLGKCLNHAIDNSDFPYFSKCDDDNYYAPNFVSDLMNTYKYADAEIVGKLNYYCYLEGCKTLAMMCPNMEYRYVNMISGSALIIKREVFEKVRFKNKPAGSDSVFLRDCLSNGVRMYSADRFNYVYKRHASQKNHTFKMEDEVFLRSCKIVDIIDDFTQIVTV